MTLGAGTFLTGFKTKKQQKKPFWEEKKKRCNSSTVPTPKSPSFAYDLLCAHPTPSLFQVTKTRQREAT